MTIFGDRAGPGMLALVQQGQGGLVSLTTELQNSAGAATEMANTMESGPGGAFRTLEGSMEDLAITFGDTLIPAIMPFVDILKETANWLSGLDKNTLTIIVTIAALAAALGPVLIVLGMLISSIGTIITVIPLLSAALLFLAANPIVLIIVAIVALVAALYYLEQKFHWIEAITAAFGAGWSVLWDGMVWVVQGAANLITGIMDSIVGGIRWAVNAVIDGANMMIRGLNMLNFSVPDWVPLIGGSSIGFSLSQIPRLAEGGVVTQPTIAMIGEAGPEAVVPLSGGNAGMGGVTIKIDKMEVRNDQDIQKIGRELYTLIDRTNRGRGTT
jgi:hypothetical protein